MTHLRFLVGAGVRGNQVKAIVWPNELHTDCGQVLIVGVNSAQYPVVRLAK